MTVINEVSSAVSNTTQIGGGIPHAERDDFLVFLKLLTAQIENQDPLAPLDATTFATQLASFSMVEQQAVTNSLLTQIAQNGGADLAK